MSKKAQLFVAYLSMYTAAIVFTYTFPFASEMVMEFGGASDRDSTGFWVGMIATSLMIGRVLSSPLWGYIIDIWGRKSVTQFSLFCIVFIQISFALCRSILSAMIIRLLLGLISPLMISSKTLVSEIWKDNIPEAMVWVTISWNLGSISGSLFGGMLSNPNSSGLTSLDFFDEYPFFLCSIIPGIVSLLTLILGFIFLKETLVKTGPNLLNYKSRGIKEITFDPKVFPILMAYFTNSYVFTAFQELLTLFAWSKRSSGGLEYSSSQIGYILGIGSIGLLLIQRNLFLHLKSRFGILKLGKYTWSLIPLVTIVLPMVSFIENEIALYVVTVFLCFIFMFLEFCNCTTSMVALNNSVPYCELGKVTGISMSLNCISRAFAPALMGSLFAVCIKSKILPHPFNYSIGFYSLAAVECLGLWCFLKVHKSSEEPYKEDSSDVQLIDIVEYTDKKIMIG